MAHTLPHMVPTLPRMAKDMMPDHRRPVDPYRLGIQIIR